MTWRETIAHLKKSPADAWYYVQGEYRLYIYRRWPKLIRAHIREQYEWRKKAASVCYSQGSCRCCGCTSPDVFFANKECSIANPKYASRCKLFGPPCYPAMMGPRQWKRYQKTVINTVSG